MNNNIFRDELVATWGSAPDSLVPGQFSRWGPKKQYYAKPFSDNRGGIHGNWQTGEQYTWFVSNDSTPSRREIIEAKRIATLARKQREDETRTRQLNAAIECRSKLVSAGQAPANFPYFISKQMETFAGLFGYSNNTALAPLETAEGLVNLQSIFHDGRKRFHPGALVTGAYFVVQVPTHHTRIIICEGIATGCTLATIEPAAMVIAAMNCGNLLPIALTIRDAHPHDAIVIAGDNDRHTEGNPGRTKANEAARAIGAQVAIPEFPPGVAGTDFNDLYVAGVAI